NDARGVLHIRVRLKQQMPTAAAGDMCPGRRQLCVRVPCLCLDVLKVEIEHNELTACRHANEWARKVRKQYPQFLFVTRRLLKALRTSGPVVGANGEAWHTLRGQP